MHLVTDHVNGPGTAIGPVYVCVCLRMITSNYATLDPDTLYIMVYFDTIITLYRFNV